jgi:hypothetical protein
MNIRGEATMVEGSPLEPGSGERIQLEIWAMSPAIMAPSILVNSDPLLPLSIIILLFGGIKVRKFYKPCIKLDPKINAALLLEKARTGMTISEIAELAFRQYYNGHKKA